MSYSVLFISWESPPSRFVKMNFDGNIKGRRGRAKFIIRNSDDRFLTADSSHLFESSVPSMELHVVWAEITFVRQQLHAE